MITVKVLLCKAVINGVTRRATVIMIAVRVLASLLISSPGPPRKGPIGRGEHDVRELLRERPAVPGHSRQGLHRASPQPLKTTRRQDSIAVLCSKSPGKGALIVRDLGGRILSKIAMSSASSPQKTRGCPPEIRPKMQSEEVGMLLSCWQ